MNIEAIVALNNLGYIGKNNKMMWKSKSDFAHFKKLTIGNVLIVGKNTFEGDLKGKGLPGRDCVVVGSGYNTQETALEKAIALAREKKCKVFIIGGQGVFESMEHLVTTWHISIIDNDEIGDKKFVITPDIKLRALFYYFQADNLIHLE